MPHNKSYEKAVSDRQIALPALSRTPALRPNEVSDVTAAAVQELLHEGES